MRPIWTGALTFGLVNIPVQMHPAVRSEERVSFRLLHKDDFSPIRYDRVCQRDGDVVPWSDIVKGYEYSKGKFVVLDEDDFKAAAIDSSKTFEILDFVNADEIDSRYFATPYYFMPSTGGETPYALLREAIRKTNTVGIGKITMRSNSHHLAGVRVVGEALVLEIMRFAGELVDAGTLEFPPADGVRRREVQMAEQLIANLSEPFDPAKYHDQYHDNLMRIIRAKLKGKKVEFEEPAERETTNVVDLMARLQESIKQGKKTARAPARTAASRESRHGRTRTKKKSA